MSYSPTLRHNLQTSIAWRGPLPINPLSAFGQSTGSPENILDWLEQQLGHKRKPASNATRVLQYAARLGKAQLKVSAASFALDTWGTAANLLQRRDDLLMWGWNGKSDKRLPALASDLAETEAIEELLAPGTSERINLILRALDDGQVLPFHQIIIRDHPSTWPKAWHPLLGRLTIAQSQFSLTPAAAKNTALHSIQERLGGKDINTKPDESLMWWRAASDTAAADAVATLLAANGPRTSTTAILCEDPVLASLLDDRLRQRGVPAVGSSIKSSSHPILQVLPLSIGLIWDPVDPAILLDMLTLPKSPFGSAADGLAKAVAKQPGIGGELWNEVVNGLKTDGKTKALDTIAHWLPVAGATREKPLPQKTIIDRCGLVSRWAMGMSVFLSKSDLHDSLIPAFEQLANQSRILSGLAGATPAPLTEAHLERLLSAAQEGGATLVEKVPEAGGPTLLRNLANLPDHCEWLIWLGTTGGQHAPSSWSVAEREALRSCGIAIESAELALTAERLAERAALCHLKGGLLAIELESHSDMDTHPLWVEASTGLPHDAWQPLELGLAGPPRDWPTPLAVHKLNPLVQPEPIWHVNPMSLHDIETSSYFEIETRLGCPLKWTFDYAARLKPSRVAGILSEFRLFGTIAHKVLEITFGGSTIPANAGEAEEMAITAFRGLLPTEAAPLALPSAARARQRLEAQFGHAAREFHELLSRGGYRVVGFEVEPGGKLDGRDFNGRPDCILETGQGVKGIVDLKYAGKKYREWIENGTAVQLAVYAAAVAGDGNGGGLTNTAAAYFIIDSARIFTPASSPIIGSNDQIPGPSIADTWSRIATALSVTTTWLKTGEVPARPLQAPSDWPRGAELALRHNKRENAYELCIHCDHSVLCGKKAIE